MKKHDNAHYTINVYVNGDNNEFNVCEKHSHHHGTAYWIVLSVILGTVLIAAVLLVAHFCPDLTADFVRAIISMFGR